MAKNRFVEQCRLFVPLYYDNPAVKSEITLGTQNSAVFQG